MSLSTPGESPENMSLEEIRQMVEQEAPRIAELGQWPDYMKSHAVDSLTSRIPSAEKTNAPGFDAGIACTLNMIPEDKQKLSATLHGAYTPSAVEQVRREKETMDPDSETAWWLAACSECTEGKVDEKKFREQLRNFGNMAADPKLRSQRAKEELEKMMSKFETETYGVPYGTEDGCMQGAYLAGYPFASNYAENYGIYFIGTYLDSLGLEDFPWSDEKDEQGRAKSGPVFGSRQFVKCANEEEFKRALEVVKKKFQQT